METITFMTSLLTFYLKGEIKKEQNFIKLKQPNTILSLIPLGAKSQTIPINQISSVETNFKLLLKNFVVGFIEAILGLSLLGDSAFWGLILTLIGLATVINSFQTTLEINTTSGKPYILYFLIFEKQKAEESAQHINILVSNRLDDTNTRQHTEKQTDALVDAIKSINKD